MEIINVTVLDSKRLYQESLEDSLSLEKDFRVIRVQNDDEIQESFKIVDKIDVLVLTITYPFYNYLSILNFVSEHFKHTKTLILGNSIEKETVYDSLNYGAKGFISKDVSLKELKQIIREVHQNGFYITSVVSNYFSDFVNEETKRISLNKISAFAKQEVTFLQLLCQQKSLKEISVEMNLSVRSVETIKSKLLKKTDVKTSIGLSLFAIKNGFFEIE